MPGEGSRLPKKKLLLPPIKPFPFPHVKGYDLLIIFAKNFRIYVKYHWTT